MQLEVLGGEGVDQADRCRRVAAVDERDALGGQAEVGGEPGDRVGDAVAERAAHVEQRRHGARAVLGLGEQVGRDPVDLPGRVGHDQHLAGSGQAVDAYARP